MSWAAVVPAALFVLVAWGFVAKMLWFDTRTIRARAARHDRLRAVLHDPEATPAEKAVAGAEYFDMDT